MTTMHAFHACHALHGPAEFCLFLYAALSADWVKFLALSFDLGWVAISSLLLLGWQEVMLTGGFARVCICIDVVLLF